MKKKLEVIEDAIQKSFPGAEIVYLIANELLASDPYKFRIRREGRHPWCWLYFDREYLEDHDEQEILDRLRRSNVFEILSNASKPMHILVTETDVREVNEKM